MTCLILGGGTLVVVLVCTLPHRLGIGLAFDYLIRRQSGDLVEPDSAEGG